MRRVFILGWLAAAGVWGQQILLRVRFAQFDVNAEEMLAPDLTATASTEIRTLRPGLDLVTLLEDLRARGAGVRMLAEPTLLAADARPVTLLAGQRDLGIHLRLQPTITREGIRLSVKPSVSTLSPAQITVPTFGTRTTAVELTLAPGQSVMIDGLLDEATKALLRNVPGNGLLDAILKNGTQPNTKLVVIVTPEVL